MTSKPRSLLFYLSIILLVTLGIRQAEATSDSPEWVVRRFYQSMSNESCNEFLKSLPNYDSSCCRNFKSRINQATNSFSTSNLSLVDLDINYSANCGSGHVVGCVVLNKINGKWHHGNFRNSTACSSIIQPDKYARSPGQPVAIINGKSVLPETPVDYNARPYQPTELPTVNGNNSSNNANFRSNPNIDDTRTLNQNLQSCPVYSNLNGTRREKIIRRDNRRGRPDIPHYSLVQQVENTRHMLQPNLRNSIRWVDLYDPESKVIALTFDLCEQENQITGYDAAIVDYLREHNIKATFFAGGKWMSTHANRAKQLILDPNFEIGNHAWTHGNLRVMRGQEMREQIIWPQAQYMKLRAEIARECGTTVLQSVPLVPSVFRFPYGTCNTESLQTLADYGLAAIQWDIVTGDPARQQNASGIVRSIINNLKPGRGSIVIMHANGRGHHTAEALPVVIPKLQRLGYSFVTVSELLKLGVPHAVEECYEIRPGDNRRYDRIFGKGIWH